MQILVQVFFARIVNISQLFRTGVVHSTCTCDGCFKKPILGMRWRCLECIDYDLCTGCYMADEHNKHHNFERIDSSDSEGYVFVVQLATDKLVSTLATEQKAEEYIL